MKWIMRVIVFIVGISALASSIKTLESSDKYFGRYKYVSTEQIYTKNMENTYEQYVQASEILEHPKSAFYGFVINHEAKIYQIFTDNKNFIDFGVPIVSTDSYAKVQVNHEQDSHYTGADIELVIPTIFTSTEDEVGYLNYDYEIFVGDDLAEKDFDLVEFTFVSNLSTDDARRLFYSNALYIQLYSGNEIINNFNSTNRPYITLLLIVSLLPILLSIGLMLGIVNIFDDTERKTLAIQRILGMSKRRMILSVLWDKINTLLVPFLLAGGCCLIATLVIGGVKFSALDYFLLILFFMCYLLLYTVCKVQKIFKTDLSKLGAFI